MQLPTKLEAERWRRFSGSEKITTFNKNCEQTEALQPQGGNKLSLLHRVTLHNVLTTCKLLLTSRELSAVKLVPMESVGASSMGPVFSGLFRSELDLFSTHLKLKQGHHFYNLQQKGKHKGNDLFSHKPL